MAFSWFTGSRKKSPDREEPLQTSESDYVLLEKPTVAPAPSQGSHLPYSIAPALYPSIQNTASNADDSIGQNLLHGVPFKLSSHITFLTDSSVTSELFVEELSRSIAEKHLMASFEYDFSLERGVSREQ